MNQQRHPGIARLKRVIDEYNGFILITHPNPDIDGIGSMIALYEYLKQLGKKVVAYCPDDIPDYLRYFDPHQSIKEFNPTGYKLECCEMDAASTALLLVDFGSMDRIHEIAKYLLPYTSTVFMVDHHIPEADVEPANHFLDVNTIATGEMVASYLLEEKSPLSATQATALYAAIMYDSGSFRFSRTTSTTHRIIANLIDAGADPTEIYDSINQQYDVNRLRLISKALSRLQLFNNQTIGIFYVTSEEIRSWNLGLFNIEGVVNLPLCIKKIQISIFLYEKKPGEIKLSLRSKSDEYDVQQLAKRFNGGGHIQAAGAKINLPLDECLSLLEQAIITLY